MRDLAGPSEITIRIHNYLMGIRADPHKVAEVALAEDWVPAGYAKRRYVTRYKDKRIDDVSYERAVRFVISTAMSDMARWGSIERDADGTYRVLRPLKGGGAHDIVKPRGEVLADAAWRNARMALERAGGPDAWIESHRYASTSSRAALVAAWRALGAMLNIEA